MLFNHNHYVKAKNVCSAQCSILHVSRDIIDLTSVVLTTLLYGAESYGSQYRRHMHLIERYRYHQRCLRAILNIHWSDFVTNIEVLEMAKVTSIEAMLLKTQLCCGRTCLQDRRPSPTKDRTIIFMENYPLAIVTKGHLRKYTKSIA